MIRARSYGAICLAAFSFAIMEFSPAKAQDLNLLRRPQNAAISVPLGQGLDMIHSAEPLGKGRFRVRAHNRSVGLTIPELGQGSIYTGNYGYAFGFSPAIDISLLVPFLLDSAGGLNKYGTGDPVVGIKYARQTKVPASSHSAFQLLFTLPLGYKGEHALDKVGGIRPFSTESVDLGLQYLVDFHFRRLSLYLNGGFFRSGNVDVLSQLVYGLGIEIGRQNRWASFNVEYQTRIAFAQESRASGALKFGTRIQMFRGVQLELNREIGFLDNPNKGSFTFGVRMHGFRRKLGTRHTLYIPPAPPKRIYEPEKVLRIAILGFEGFEEYDAGPRLVAKIKSELAPHDSLEVVDLARFSGLPRMGGVSPLLARDLARKLDVDVVVTGEVLDYEIKRFAGIHLPYLVELPETRVDVRLRFRVLEFFGPEGEEMEAFTATIDGVGRARKRVRLIPVDRRNVTATASARELSDIQNSALDDVAGNMLASMAERFSWTPPDFLP